MEDGDERVGESDEAPEDAPHSSVMERHYIDLGERVEELKHTLSWRRDRELFPYEVRVRWPVKQSDEFLAVVKWVERDQPVIAFNTGRGPMEVLFSLSDRYRAGKLKVVEDQYPPENFDKWVKHVDRRLEFLGGLRSKPPHGS